MTKTIVALALCLPVVAAAEDPNGKVKLPVAEWEQLLAELEQKERPERPPLAVSPIERRITGSLQKGLFSANLLARFEVFAQEHVKVPVLDGLASLSEVRLNGARTSLERQGDMYVVGIDKPGVYTLDVAFFWGKEQDRFARRLRFRLPEGGPTAVAITVPEQDIEPRLSQGVLTGREKRPGGTLLTGQLSATGLLDLSWNRQLLHKTQAAAKLEARESAVLNIQEAAVTGVAVFDLDVTEGETDRADFVLPAGLEVLRVEGDAVLQWHTEDKGGAKLVVLFRYLVEEETRVSVHFQAPVDPKEPLSVKLPSLPPGVPVTGLLGVQAPAGLRVQVTRAEKAEAYELADLPAELTDLTKTPLLMGWGFSEPPEIVLTVARHEAVELTITVVDDLEASSVINEDGTEVTKLKLRMRNNARQYLTVRLPEEAVLTHSLIDGQPVRPAVVAAEGGEALLLPLRQSERLAGRQRTHVVQGGETLTGLANMYFSDPTDWQRIQDANEELVDGGDLYVGQELVIPAPKDSVVQESSFVIELAYKRPHDALTGLGGARLELPQIDVDTVEATWHVYVPDAVEPLSFDSNLTQYSAIRYDPFRRLRDFLQQALVMRDAWAGGGKYESILRQRKGIWQAEASKKAEGKMVLATFPLVGRRLRFKDVLLGREQPFVSFVHMPRAAAPVLHGLAFGLGLVLTILALRARARKLWWLVAAGGLLVCLVLGHFVLGVHRRLLWGIDLGLLVTVLRLGLPGLRARFMGFFEGPLEPFGILSLANLGRLTVLLFALTIFLWFPLLLSSLAFALLLAFWWWRVVRLAAPRPGTAATAATLGVLLIMTLGTAARAQEGDELIEEQELEEEELQEADVDIDDVVEGDAAPANEEEGEETGRSDAQFDSLMNALPSAPAPVIPSVWPHGSPVTGGSEVEVPLPRYEEVRRRVMSLRQDAARAQGPAVILGSAQFSGTARQGALSLVLDLQVTLGAPGKTKLVPLVGDDVVVARASAGGASIPLARQNGYHVWVTKKTGEVPVRLEILVPARGPRGSLEYDFRIARTPVTRFECSFPVAGLEPRITAAVRSEVRTAGGTTRLTAALKPTTRLHLVGFRDLGEGEQKSEKVYAETLNLLSIDEGSTDLFTVVRYTILYAGAKEFQLLIPPEMTVVSADGMSAFRYETERTPQGTLLKGETAFPIRKAYEISLRLHKETPRDGESFDVPLPRALKVERQQGWLAIEAPGKLRVEEAEKKEALAVDVRQLPPEMLESAVSPILKAYRFHTPEAKVRLTTSRLPEKEPVSGSVDRVRATSLVSTDGKVLTDLRIGLRNRLRHSLTLALAEGTQVRSTLLDGEPVKPSRDPEGRLVVPLKRSEGQAQLQPFVVQVVFENELGSLGWVGAPDLVLPALDLPISSLAWSIFAPARNVYSRPEGDVEPVSLFGSATWFQPTGGLLGGLEERDEDQDGDGPQARGPGVTAGSADTGAMSVRITIPKGGRELTYQRYWLAGGRPVEVSFWYLRSFLIYPLALLGFVLTAAGSWWIVGFWPRSLRASGRAAPGAVMLALGAPLLWWSWGEGGVELAIVVGLVALAWRRGVLRALGLLGWSWARGLPMRFRAGMARQAPLTAGTFLLRVAVTGGFFIAGLLLLIAVLAFISLLQRPLA